MPWYAGVGLTLILVALADYARAQSLPPDVSPELIQQAKDACRTLEQVDPERAKELCRAVTQGARAVQTPQAAPAPVVQPARPVEKDPAPAPAAATARTVEPSRSDLERFFENGGGDGPGLEEPEQSLSQFGYELFDQTVSAPPVDMPVTPDYLIGPGDEFTVTLWGLVDASYTVEVDRNGEITLPRAGVIPVAGARYDELRPLLERRLAKYYTDFHLSVVMGRLRSIRVYVVGEVQRPGSLSLSSLSTAYNALFAAGGPTRRGSLRTIQLIRGGKTVAAIDLYDFLLKGDRTRDMRLQHEDTVLVPLIGATVGVAGNVLRPAIYELKGAGGSLADALSLAGGPKPTADLNRVQIERVEAHERRVAVDLDLSKVQDAAHIPVKSMDLVKLFPIYEIRKGVVRLSGHVVRPGTYELKNGMRVGDLVQSYEQLLPEPSLTYSEIVRYEWPTMARTVIPFSIRKVMDHDPENNVVLQDRDEVRVYPASRFQDTQFVTINGEVRHPGRYRLYERMSVLELVRQAGDPTPEALIERAEIRRKVPSDDASYERQIMYFRLDQLLEGNEEHRPMLEPDDEVVIHAKRDAKALARVTVRGAVKKPGEYPLLKDMRVKDLLFEGGLTRESELGQAELIRLENGNVNGEIRRTVVPINLTRVLAEDPAHNVDLRGDDELLIKQVGELKREYRVTLDGEVRFPGTYAIQAGERISSLLRRAGGLTDKAFLRGAVFTRASVKDSQQQRLREMSSTYTQRVTAEAAAVATAGLSKEETDAAKFELMARQNAIKLLGEQTELGRIVVNLKPPEELEGTANDLVLEDGDRLLIPQAPSSVSVLGSVRNPTSVVARDGASLKKYVSLAGGYLPEADRKAVYVVKADGTSVSPDRIKSIEAGDTILVPPDTEPKYRPLPLWRDVATILGQVVVTIAALVVIL
jgi:polysaccharide export outer membrane protein